MSEHEIDPFIEDIAGELKRPVRFDSTFESRVMAALDSSVVPLPVQRKASTPWILRPRTFYVSPLAGLAVAAGLVAVITMSVLRTVPPDSVVATAPNVQPSIVVTPTAFDPLPGEPNAFVTAPFTYVDSKAKSVAIVGSFNDWDATKDVLTLTGDSVWTANVRLLAGRYEYQFVVDGKWTPDPKAQRSADSDFGGANSVVIVSPVPR